MKTILVPTDFSKHAGYALDLAYELAKKGGAEVRLLHVVEYPGIDSINVTGDTTLHDSMDKVFMLQLLKKVKTQIKTLAEDPKYSEVEMHYNVMIGHAFKNISKEISDVTADIVIIGSHGISGAAEALMGSTAEKVVRQSHCPVLTVKEPVNVNLLKDIIYATNMNGDQSHVLDEIKKLQKILHAKIHLLRVNTPYAFIGTQEVTEKLENFAKSNNLDDYTVNVYDEFREETGILHFADTIDADIIAMATHGHSGLVHLFTGSIAEDVVNHAKRPVWTLSLKS